jgi:hypothetical protein
MKRGIGLALGLAGAVAMAGVSFARPNRHDRHNPPEPPTTFSAADFNGTYVATFQGSVSSGGSSGVLTGNGLLTANPTSATGGTVAGTETINDGALGDVCSGSVNGTYSINPDGTGTWQTTFTPNGAINIGNCATSTNTASLVLRSDHSASVVQTDQYQSSLGHLSLQKMPNSDGAGDDGNPGKGDN